MEYPKYKPGQRVFALVNGVLCKGIISRSKKIYKRGLFKYYLNDLCLFDSENHFYWNSISYPQKIYVHVAHIASFNDKYIFGKLIQKYQNHLMKEKRKIETQISELNKSKCCLIDKIDSIERFLCI